MNERQATAILMGNLKGPKNKPTDIIIFSNACRFLIKKWGIKEVSKYCDVSESMLRQIEKITLLDPITKNYIKKHHMGIEKAYQLWRVDKPIRIKLLPLIRNLTTKDVRNLVYLIHHEPSKSIEECKKKFDEKYARETTIMVLTLPSDLIYRLTYLSKIKKIKPNQYVMNLIKVACNE